MDAHDKRQLKGRFGWVRRLVQGQNKPEHTIRTSTRAQALPKLASAREVHSVYLSQRSGDLSSDAESMSVQSDNVSTVPVKLIVSTGSNTAPPSVLSGEHNQDNLSIVASTAETSIAPSTHVSIAPSAYGHLRSERDRERERDSELIITLASSSRRVRRRSIDTNCSLAGIPPASIIERLLVNPTPRSVDEIET